MTDYSRRAVLARTGGAALAIGCGVGTTSGPAAAQSADGWPMCRANAANTGVGAGPAPGSVTERWSYETGTTVRSSPAVAGGTAYLGGADGTVHAVDVQSGDRVWVAQVGGAVVSSPAVAGGRVYVTGRDGVVRALGAETGLERWTAALDRGTEASPTTVDGTVYVGGNDGRVRALAAETGEERWAAEVGGGVAGAPAVVDGTVYAATVDGEVAALEAGSGTADWDASLFRGVRTPPVVTDGLVCIASDSDAVLAFDAGSGEQRWEYDVSTADRVPLVATGDSLLVGSANDKVHSLDPGTGAQRYEFDAGVGARAVAGFRDAFCVATGQRVRLVDTESARARWSVNLAGGSSSALAVTGRSVYVVRDDGTMARLAPEAGSTPSGSGQSSTPDTGGAQADGQPSTPHAGGAQADGQPSTPDAGGAQADGQTPAQAAASGGGASGGGEGTALPGPAGTALVSLGGLAGIAVLAAYLRRRGSGDETGVDGSGVAGRSEGTTPTDGDPAPSPVPGASSGTGGVSETLAEAEDDMEEAVAAFVDGERVVSRVRFRQATNRFEDALEQVGGDDDLGVEVSAAAAGVPADLGSVPGLDPEAIGSLRASGYGDIDDLSAASVDELVDEAGLDEETAALAVVAGIGNRNAPRRFETVADVEARRDAAALGRRLCGRGG